MRGFSLVEMLLSLAIVAVLIGLSAPLYFSYQTNNEFGLAVDTGVRSLRRAQFLAMNAERDSNWGTYFSTSGITIYLGDSYAGRNADYDEQYDFPSTVSSTAVMDANFSKFYGGLAVATSTTIRSNAGDSVVITVNSKGMVDY